MSGYTLTSDATMTCPHGGTISAVPANTTITAGGPVLVQTDTLTIAGCTFVLPIGVTSPCVQVQWVAADTRCSVNGTPTLSQGSTGLCMAATGIPQGTVLVTVTQTRAQSV